MATMESLPYWRQQQVADVVISVGSRSELEQVAQHLYGVLRQFDDEQVQFIVGETFPRSGIGMAVMNRLEKAAGGRILAV